MSRNIQTDSLRIDFAEDFSIEGLFILADSTKVCANGNQRLIIRTHDEVADPFVFEKVSSFEKENGVLRYRYAEKDYSAEVRYTKVDGELVVNIQTEAPKPIWLIEWELSDLNFDEILIPALGGQSISKEMPDGKSLSYKYPFWWNSQFVIGRTTNGGVILRSEDKSNDLKLLRIKRDDGSFTITYGVEAPAPLKSNKLKGEFILEGFKGDWENGVDIHKKWMKENFGLVKYKDHPHYPEWMNQVNFILELWGARKTMKSHHSFEQMIDRVKKWKDLHNPKETLLYLPGFANNGVDSRAPNMIRVSSAEEAKSLRNLLKLHMISATG